MNYLIVEVTTNTIGLSEDDVEMIKDNIDIIRTKIVKNNPKKRFVRIAIKGLELIKGTTELSVAVVALIEFDINIIK